MASDRDLLRSALGPGKECLPLEKLEACLDPRAIPAGLSGHLESCAYCRSELELLRSFHGEVRPEEMDAVNSVVNRLRMPLPERAAPRSRWKGLFGVRWLAPAAVAMAGVLIVAAVGLQLRHSRVPQIESPAAMDGEVLRSGSIAVLSPTGDVEAVPTRIRWEPAAQAAEYQVEMLEVDRNPLWSARTSETQIEVPLPVQAKIVPAKTLLLRITAVDSSGRKLAESEPVRFRLLQKVHTR